MEACFRYGIKKKVQDATFYLTMSNFIYILFLLFNRNCRAIKKQIFPPDITFGHYSIGLHHNRGKITQIPVHATLMETTLE